MKTLLDRLLRAFSVSGAWLVTFFFLALAADMGGPKLLVVLFDVAWLLGTPSLFLWMLYRIHRDGL